MRLNFLIRHGSRLLATLGCGLAWVAGAASAAPPPPNIVLLLADDLGYGDLGCYGQAKIKTPNLDRLAAEGMRFTSAYAGSTVCAPSRCALMTGLHTGHGLIRGNKKVPLRPEDVTLAEVLKQAGYHTGLVGKWGLGNEHTTGVPQKHGFDEFIGFLDQVHAHDYYTSYLWRYDPRTGFDAQMPFFENSGGKRGLYMPDIFQKAAQNFLRLNRPDPATGGHPFFLFFSSTLPHANNEETRHSGNGMQIPSDAPYGSEAWPPAEKNKAAMITRLDTDVGKILDQLKSLGLEEDTLVIFASDNGPHREGGVNSEFFRSSGPLRGIKRDLYEGGIRVPVIARWPGKVKPGAVSDEPWAFWDLLPTLAELTGQKPPADLDGISILPTLLGRPQTRRHDFFYWEFHERGFQQAARMGDWKAIRLKPGEPLELYNLTKDIGERHDVAAEHPEVVRQIEDYLKRARTESDEWPVAAKH